MASRFRLYSTEIEPTVDPDNADPAPDTLIAFDQDPLFGEYDSDDIDQARGCVIRTLGGVVVQDFGVQASDGVISFSDSDALDFATAVSLAAAYETIDGQFYFTDGYECWKVQFSRNPAGFKLRRNILAGFHNLDIFSYEIRFLVVSKEI